MGAWGAAQNHHKFDSASEATQLRFMRLWVKSMRRLATRTLAELHVEMAPLNGSLECLQDALYKGMYRWLIVWVETSKVRSNYHRAWKKKANFPILEELKKKPLKG